MSQAKSTGPPLQRHSLKVIPQYSTAHRVLCIISHNQANKHICIPRTWYCLSINVPGKEVQQSLPLKWAQWLCLISHNFGAQSHYSKRQIMTLKGMTQGTFSSWYRLNLRAIPTNYISNCSMHSRLTTNQVFFQLQQNVQWTDEMTCMISASTGINGVSLMHISPKQARWPISLTVFFETDIGKEHLRKVYRKLSNDFFSEESPWR